MIICAARFHAVWKECLHHRRRWDGQELPPEAPHQAGIRKFSHTFCFCVFQSVSNMQLLVFCPRSHLFLVTFRVFPAISSAYSDAEPTPSFAAQGQARGSRRCHGSDRDCGHSTRRMSVLSQLASCLFVSHVSKHRFWPLSTLPPSSRGAV